MILKNLGKSVKYIFILSILMSLLSCSTIQNRESATEVFSDFMQYLKLTDYDEAYALLSEQSKNVISHNDFAEWRILADEMYTLNEFNVWFRKSPQNYARGYSNYKIDDQYYEKVYIASVNMTLTDKTTGFSQVRTADRFIVKEYGEWKVYTTKDISEILEQHKNSSFKDNSILTDANQANNPVSIKKFGLAELQMIGTVPFIRLQGSYFDMGLQYGTLLKEQLIELQKEMQPVLDSLKQKITPDERQLMEELLGEFFLDQLKGMAQGSSLDFEDLLFGTWYGELSHNEYCTSILLKTPGGLLHGRNLDDEPLVARYPVIIEYSPENRNRSLVMGVIGDMGISEGINQKGVSISGNSGPGAVGKQGLIGLPYALIRREILDTANTLKSAESLLEEHKANSGTIITVGSSEENAGFIAELLYDKTSLSYMDTAKTLFATNTFSDPVFTRKPAAESCFRFQQIDEYTRRNTIISVEQLIGILALTNEPYGVNNTNTRHSVVIDPARGIIYFANDEEFAPFSTWYQYDWSEDIFKVYKNAFNPVVFF